MEIVTIISALTLFLFNGYLFRKIKKLKEIKGENKELLDSLINRTNDVYSVFTSFKNINVEVERLADEICSIRDETKKTYKLKIEKNEKDIRYLMEFSELITKKIERKQENKKINNTNLDGKYLDRVESMISLMKEKETSRVINLNIGALINGAEIKVKNINEFSRYLEQTIQDSILSALENLRKEELEKGKTEINIQVTQAIKDMKIEEI